MSDRPAFVYLLRCADGSLYTGVTTDLAALHTGARRTGSIGGSIGRDTHGAPVVPDPWAFS